MRASNTLRKIIIINHISTYRSNIFLPILQDKLFANIFPSPIIALYGIPLLLFTILLLCYCLPLCYCNVRWLLWGLFQSIKPCSNRSRIIRTSVMVRFVIQYMQYTYRLCKVGQVTSVKKQRKRTLCKRKIWTHIQTCARTTMYWCDTTLHRWRVDYLIIYNSPLVLFQDLARRHSATSVFQYPPYSFSSYISYQRHGQKTRHVRY